MPFLALVLTLLPVPEKQEHGNHTLGKEKGVPCFLPLLERNENREAKQDAILFSMLRPASQRPLLRVVACSEAGIRMLSAFLQEGVPGTLVRIAENRYQVTAVERMGSAWAGLSTWDDFVLPPFGRSFHFFLGTPLVLHTPLVRSHERGPEMSSFPASASLFDGLAQRWQRMGGPDLPVDRPQLSAWLGAGGCVVSDYALQGFPVVLSPEEQALGFLGRIMYTCRGETVALQRVLTALTRFAFFAGVGRFNAQGMGTTRVRIEP